MKFEEYLDTYYEFSGKASDSARQLSFAAIAVIWIFRNSDGSQQLLPGKLVLAAFFVALSLAFDLFQYIAGTLIWGIFHSGKERHGVKADAEIKAPTWLNKPMLYLFIAKIVCLITGYVFILVFLGNKL